MVWGYDEIVSAVVKVREVVEECIKVNVIFNIPSNTGRDGRGRYGI